MKPLSRPQEARWFFISAVAVLLSTPLLRDQLDWSDTGVVVIWIVAMLLLIAAIRHFIAMNSGEDGRTEMESPPQATGGGPGAGVRLAWATHECAVRSRVRLACGVPIVLY